MKLERKKFLKEISSYTDRFRTNNVHFSMFYIYVELMKNTNRNINKQQFAFTRTKLMLLLKHFFKRILSHFKKHCA